MALFSGLDTPRYLSPEESWNKPQKESIGDVFLTSFAEGLKAKKDAKGDTTPMPAFLSPWADKANAQSADRESLDFAKQADHLKIQQATMGIARDASMMEYQTQAKQGEAALASAMAGIAKAGDWANPKARADFFDVGAKFPAVTGTPAWKQAQESFDKADKNTVLAEQYRLRAEQAETTAGLSQQRLEIEKAKEELQAEKQGGSPAEPSTKTLGDGTILAWMPGGNTLHVLKPGSEAKKMSAAQLIAFAKTLGPDDPDYNNYMAAAKDMANTEIGKPTAASTPIDLPANASAKTLKKGQMYHTKRGDATWDGTQFVMP